MLRGQVRAVASTTVHEQRWTLCALDGDMYESTMDGLTNHYPGLAPTDLREAEGIDAGQNG